MELSLQLCTSTYPSAHRALERPNKVFRKVLNPILGLVPFLHLVELAPRTGPRSNLNPKVIGTETIQRSRNQALVVFTNQRRSRKEPFSGEGLLHQPSLFGGELVSGRLLTESEIDGSCALQLFKDPFLDWRIFDEVDVVKNGFNNFFIVILTNIVSASYGKESPEPHPPKPSSVSVI